MSDKNISIIDLELEKRLYVLAEEYVKILTEVGTKAYPDGGNNREFGKFHMKFQKQFARSLQKAMNKL